MNPSFSRAYAQIDLDALRSNFELVRRRIAPTCKIMSVVKADAYGHGVIPVARTLRDSDYFAVACHREAMELREAGIETPILILGYTDPTLAPCLAENDLTQCVFDTAYAMALQEHLPGGTRLKIHLKIDTGMSRLGFYTHTSDDAARTAEEIEALLTQTPSLDAEGIFTHFSSSESHETERTEEQFAVFTYLLELLERNGITFPLRHCCNSAGILYHPDKHLDMVRPGILLYGGSPDPSRNCGEKPILSLKARIAQIRDVLPSDTVSYNETFRAKQPMRVAVICIGYGDGYPRALSGKTCVIADGKTVPILGRVCMDQCMIDVTGLSLSVGDEVTMIGSQADQTVTAADLARLTETIDYEILCHIGKRIDRTYISDEKESIL